MKTLTQLRRQIRDLEDEPEKALPYWQQAAAMGDYSSICSLIHAYTYGDMGVEANLAKVYEYTLMGAQLGEGWCQYNAAICLRDGLGCQPDPEASEDWMIQAALGEEKRAYLPAAEICVRRNDLEQAVRFCQQAQEQPEARELLGGIRNQQGVQLMEKGDHQQAVLFLEEGADLGCRECMVSLAYEYSLEEGIGQDFEKTYAYNLQAADAGSATAMYNLSMCCREGMGTVKDARSAFEWMKNAANAQFAEAYLPLAQHYAYGIGVRQDKETAIHWATLAIERGSQKTLASKLIEEMSGI